jgi:hypothetical protein
MRRQEIDRNINLAFKRFARRNNLIHFSQCKKHLEERLKWFNKVTPELAQSIEPYYANLMDEPDRIKNQVFYISDRWNCVGRIKFLLRVIESGF